MNTHAPAVTSPAAIHAADIHADIPPDATPCSAIPSGSFSVPMVNAVLGMFLESAATIEEIANENNLSIPTVLECLQEQKAFLLGMLGTLELRVRLLASRAEAVAIEALREVTVFARDQETRRKAASKLLSHFAKSKPPSPRPAAKSVARAAGDNERPSTRASTTTPARGTGVSPVAPTPTRPTPAHALTSEPGV